MLPTPPPGPADPFADFDQYVASLQKQETAPPPGPEPPQTAPPSSDPFSDFDQFIQPLLQERQIEQSTGMPATPISPLLNRPMIPGVAEGVEGSLRYGEGTRSQPTFGEQAASVFQAIPSGAQRQLGGLGEYLQALASAGETPGLRLPIPAEVVSAPLRAIGETLESGQEAYFRNNQEQEIRNQQIAEQHPVTGFLQDVAGQVPQLAMAMGAGGGAPALAALGASAAGQEMQRAESMGADPGQALTAGTISGAIEAATEMFGKVGLASRAFQVAEAGTPVGQGALKAILGDVAENFGQEVAASVGQRFTQLAVYEDGTYGWQDVKSALYDGLVGAVVGGGMSAATQGLSRLRGQLPSDAAPRAYADERQLGAEVLAAARAKAQEDAAKRQAADAALGEAPPAAGEIVVPEVLPLPPQPEVVPPAPPALVMQEAPPQAEAPPVVEPAPVVQTVVEEPAQEVTLYRGQPKEPVSGRVLAKQRSPVQVVQAIAGEDVDQSVEIAPFEYWSTSKEVSERYARADEHILESMASRGVENPGEMFRLMYGREPRRPGDVLETRKSLGKTLDLTGTSDAGEIHRRLLDVEAKHLEGKPWSDLTREDKAKVEASLEEQIGHETEKGKAIAFPENEGGGMQAWRLLRNYPAYPRGPWRDANNLGTKVASWLRSRGFQSVAFDEHGEKNYALLTEATPPPAPPVQPEPVVPPTQVAPQEAQNVQQAAQADVAERPAPAPDEAQPAQARGAAQAAVADREPGVVLADFGGRFASTIYKNPTQRDIQDIRKWNRTEHRDRNSMAEPQFRSLIDADGNSYAWSSFEGTHEQARAILEERGVRFQGDGQARAGSNLKDIRLQEDAVAPQPTPQEVPDALRRQEGREEGRQAVEPGVPAPPVPSPAPEVAIPAEPGAGRGTAESLAAPLPAATPAPTAPKTPTDLEAMAMPIPAPVAESTTAARERVGEARQAENDRIREEADEKIAELEQKIANAEARRTPGNSEQTDKRIARYQDKIAKIEEDAEAAIKAPIEAEIPAKERPAGAARIDQTRPPAEPRSSVEDALNARRDEVFGPIQPTTMEDKVPTVQIGTQTRPGGTQQTAHRLTRLPDLVRLAKRLMAEGVEIRNIPKKMREGLLGAVSFKNRTLMLNPKIAATPGLAEAVIAHEIGHLADMFPNRVSPIFDRILKIKNALQDLGNNAAVKRRKGLIERQAREVAREWAKRSPIQMPEKVLDSKYFATPSEVYANVTGAILNDPELVRQLAPDLYVDFMGRLDADPRLSEAWRETQEDVARPEEEKLADTLEQQREEEARGIEARLQGIRNRLKPEALTKLQKRLTGFVSRGLANYWDKRSPSYRLGRYVANELRKAGKANEADALMERMEKMQWALEDSDHFFSRISAYYDLFKEHVLAPLEAKGLTSSDFSLALRLLDQEANPDLFGSQGLRGEEASRVLNHLMKDLGQEKADALVEATQDYWVLRSTILARFAEAGTETQEGIEKILENAAYARRTGLSFLEAEATESTKAGGGPTNIEGALYSALKHREGSLQATGSALVETLLVDAAIMRASERALAKKYTVQFLRSVDGGKGEVIKSARMVGEGIFEKPPVGWELIKTREGGRTVGYFVPEAVYRGIEKAPGDTASTMKLLDYANRILRPLLVTHNPAWALFNVQRDFWAAYKNHTNPDPLGAFLETVRFASGAGAELGRLYLRARGEASERTEGWTGHLPKVLRGWVSGLTAWEQMRTPIEQEMALQAAILTMPENRNSLMAAAANLDPTKMDELQQFRAIFDLQLRKTLGDPFASVLDPNSNRFTKAMDFIEQHAKPFAALGMASERGIKIAGYRMLTARKAKLEAKRAAGTITKRQSAELERLSKPGYIPRVVRARMGSPDFLRRGLEYNRYNRWLLFSNAAKEGLRSSIEAAKDDPAGYAIKTMMVNVVPKMVTAWLVANDDDFREWYRGIPQWLRMSFTPIPMPLALGPKGESRYIPLPQDFTGAFINGLMDVLVIQGLIEDRPVTPKKILTALNPLFVYSLGSLNPAVETAYQAFSLASGSNPDDFFRGRDMFDPFAFRNMSDAQKWQTFAKETWNNMGFSLIYRPPSSWEDAGKEEQAWWQKAIDRFPVWANMSRRLRGSTDAGRREEAYEVLGPVRGRKAEERAARDEYATELLKSDPDRSDREIAEDVYRHLIDLGYTDATEAKHIIATIRALRDRLKWGTKSPEEKILDIAKTKAEEKVLRERFGIPEDEEEE